MAIPDLLALLLRVTVAATVVLIVVLALRRPLRVVFGVNAA